MKKEPTAKEIIEKKNKEIDALGDFLLDTNVSEEEKVAELDAFISGFGGVSFTLNEIEKKKKGPMFPNG